MISKETVYKHQLFVTDTELKILSFSLLFIFLVKEKISFQYPFLLPSCGKNTSAKIILKAHFCNHLSSSVIFLHWISSMSHKVLAFFHDLQAVWPFLLVTPNIAINLTLPRSIHQWYELRQPACLHFSHLCLCFHVMKCSFWTGKLQGHYPFLI